MDQIKIIEKLRDKTNVSYEEAKYALEISNWDILDAIIYLEESGRIKKPSISTFYTNEKKENYTNKIEVLNLNKDDEDNGYKKHDHNSKKRFEGIFEAICRAIDTCNNIFIEIKKDKNEILKLPLTVLVLILFFAFWIVIPLFIVGLFFDIEFFVSAKNINTIEVNNILKEIAKTVKAIKDKFKREFK